MFYKTATGAEAGDVYMSLIHTCPLGDVNPFEYLHALQLHVEDVSTTPRCGCRGTTESSCRRSVSYAVLTIGLKPPRSTGATPVRRQRVTGRPP